MKKPRNIYIEESVYESILNEASKRGLSFGDYVGILHARAASTGVCDTATVEKAIKSVELSALAIRKALGILAGGSVFDGESPAASVSGDDKERVKVVILRKYDVLPDRMTAVSAREVNDFVRTETFVNDEGLVRVAVEEMGGKFARTEFGEAYLRLARKQCSIR